MNAADPRTKALADVDRRRKRRLAFAARLKAARTRYYPSIAAAAEASGLNYQSLIEWEGGVKEPTATNLCEIVCRLGLDPAEILATPDWD